MSDKVMNRREFLGTSALGLMASGLGIRGADAGLAPKHEGILYRTLGRTGLRLPVVSFGVMNSDSPDLLRKALASGIRHLDTAHVYLRGNSERAIGAVVQESRMRDKLCIATKMRFARDRDRNVFVADGSAREPGATAANLDRQLETSLERLQTDYVDILYLHSCYSPEMATHEGLLSAMAAAKKAGKTRFIGISTHSSEPAVIRAAADTGVIDVVLTAYNAMQEHRDEVGAAIAYAAAKGVGIVAMKTQGGVRLNSERPTEVNHQASLKWVLNNQHVCTTIPGMTTFEQMDLNLGAMADLALTEAEKRELELSSMVRGPLYCQGCRSCVPSCPSRVDVPSLMRAYMYASAYGNATQAAITLEGLPVERGLDACAACTSCSAVCRRGIDIDRRVAELAASGVTRC